MSKYLCLIVGIKLFLVCNLVYAVEYTLAIQPIFPPDKLEKLYKPMADYLSDETGETIKLKTFRSFKSYWINMKRLNGFDLVLDGANFTDYRIQNENYKVIARLPDTVSFTLVTRGDLFVLDLDELIPYKIATVSAPSIAGIRLKQMYPDPKARPIFISAKSYEASVSLIKNGTADAAIIPTPLVGRYSNLNVVETTKSTPHVAFSTSPKVPKDLRFKLKFALTNASKTNNGKKMLAAVGLSEFINGTNKMYSGYANLMGIMRRK